MLLRFIKWFMGATTRSKVAIRSALNDCVSYTSFLPNFYRLNDLIWQDGMLIDFLQKKVADKWIRRFLVCSSYLFSERVVFNFVVRFYIDYIIWPSTLSATFEVSNISLLLSITVLLITALLTLFNLNYLLLLML